MNPSKALLLLFLPACSVPLKAGNSNESPLKRSYKIGETLKYEIESKPKGTYHASNIATVKKDSNGVFYEEFQWTQVQRNGRGVELPADNTDLRQLLSLDPDFKNRVPDLSKFNPALYGPITDLMTFYVDDLLAIKQSLRKDGDHAYIKHGKPNSWADGSRVLVGYDCIDFDITLIAVNEGKKTADLKVRHVPPLQGCEKVPADWMRKPVSDTANNWFQITKTEAGKYEAGVGKEIFDVEMMILLPEGIIKSARMLNSVELQERTCTDAELTDCGPSEPGKIVREISLSKALQ